MAAIAQPYSGNGAVKAPISAHPAFPAIVALWFAALLGLGSLVLPVALIEKLVIVTRIASLIPAAEPPLGFTARAGIALGAAVAGAIVGLVLARKVAQASAPEPKARSFSLEAERECRPISAHDELGRESIDSPAPAPAPQVHKRRALAMAEDNRPSAYLQAAPLPGQSFDDPLELPLPEDARSPAPAGAEIADTDFEPLELGAFAAPEEEADAQSADGEAEEGLEALRRRIHTADTSAKQDSPMIDEPFEAAAPHPNQAHGDPLPFAAPSFRRAAPPAFDEEEQSDAAQEGDDLEPANDQTCAEELGRELTIVETDGEPDDEHRPVEELGLVQLAARLGASLEKRRAWLAERQGPAPAPPQAAAPFVDTEDFQAVGAEDAARAIADFFGPAKADSAMPVVENLEQPRPPEAEPQAAIPAPLRGVPFEHYDEDEADALAASLSLPLAGAVPERQSANEPESDDEQFDEPDDGEYSSLLAMKNPFARQQEFVRVEEAEDDSGSIEPAVTFPSSSSKLLKASDDPVAADPAERLFDPPKKPLQSALPPAPAAAPRDPGDAERSLRDALATLQRMSGAA